MPVVPGKHKWVNFRQERFNFPDGRRGSRFYLIDDTGDRPRSLHRRQ